LRRGYDSKGKGPKDGKSRMLRAITKSIPQKGRSRKTSWVRNHKGLTLQRKKGGLEPGIFQK